MSTIAEKLTAIHSGIESAKTTLAANLRGVGVAASDTETLTQLAAKVADADEWHPNPYWQSLDDIADGEIGFIVRDTNEYDEAATLCFSIGVTSGNYIIDWGDGVIETLENGAYCQHTYAIGEGAPDGHGHTTYKVRVRAETTFLLRIQSMTFRGLLQTPNSIQYIKINAPTITTLSSAFYESHLLEGISDLYLPNCTAATYCFTNCVNLRKAGDVSILGANVAMTYFFGGCAHLKSVGAINVPNCSSFYGMFQNASSLERVGEISSNTAVGAPYLFRGANSLKSIQALNLPKVSDARYFGIETYSLIDVPDLQYFGSEASVFDGLILFSHIGFRGVINMPNTKFSKLEITGVSTRRAGITGINFSPASPFSGATPQINISHTWLDRAALVSVFNQLPTLSGKQINITGCAGVADLTETDLAIATGKGWTVVQ